MLSRPEALSKTPAQALAANVSRLDKVEQEAAELGATVEAPSAATTMGAHSFRNIAQETATADMFSDVA